MSDDYRGKLLNANQACEYLAQRWGLESYSLESFKKLRQRRNLEPAVGGEGLATYWTPEQLDKIEKPDRNRKRGPRKSKKKDMKNMDDSPTNSAPHQWYVRGAKGGNRPILVGV